ncbi:STAS domain-containing protein [Streptomyces mauvecolor]|uniref:STAS domain-containing protein n=1 Tax=Streptomyces mauvecolor TaxID=58345 RepID=A0ABV9UPL5_9ACTN
MEASGRSPRAAGIEVFPSAEPSAPADVGRTVVLVEGELDLDSEQTLYQQLRRALDHSVGGLVIDLHGVGFCDCSGLNTLLRVRHRALAQGKTISIRAAGPSVDRLLAMTRTRALFTPVGHTRPRPDAARALRHRA